MRYWVFVFCLMGCGKEISNQRYEPTEREDPPEALELLPTDTAQRTLPPQKKIGFRRLPGTGLSPDGRLVVECNKSTCEAKALYTDKIASDTESDPTFRGLYGGSAVTLRSKEDGPIDRGLDRNHRSHTALALDPLYKDARGNPFRCSSNGSYHAGGEYECYKLMIFTSILPYENVQQRFMRASTAEVRVKAFATGSARRIARPSVEKAFITRPWISMRRPDGSRFVAGNPVPQLMAVWSSSTISVIPTTSPNQTTGTTS